MQNNNCKTSLLIGNLPPPVTGLTVAFKTLVSGYDNGKLPYYLLDFSPGVSVQSKFRKAIAKTKRIIISIIKVPFFLPKVDVVYSLLSPSPIGFIKDFILIWLSWIYHKPIILHLHSGGYKDFFDLQMSLMKKIIKTTLERASSLIVLGDMLRDQFYFLVDQEKIKVVQNGLPKELTPLVRRTNKKFDRNRPIKITLSIEYDCVKRIYGCFRGLQSCFKSWYTCRL